MTEETLQQLIAELSKKDAEQITAPTSLDSLLPGSLGRTRLDAALRYKLGISNSNVYHVATFGDLCQLLSVSSQNGVLHEASSSDPAQLPPFPAIASSNGARKIQVGVDLESIAALPEVQDYWEDEFYKHTFTGREIGYALLQPSPRATFAGIWCAKEALRKADPSFGQKPWSAIEVVHDASGKPSMAVDGEPLDGALSLTHSGEMAAAIFVAAGPFPSAPLSAELVSKSSVPANLVEERVGGGHPIWVTLIAALALLLSIAAFATALLRR
jgi:holo-[acyl-carrier protein] synthase